MSRESRVAFEARKEGGFARRLFTAISVVDNPVLTVLDTTLASARSGFALRFGTLIWVATTGAQLVLVWWYRRQPVFWLPAQWVPGPVAYVLRFPSAPKGECRQQGGRGWAEQLEI